MADATNTLLSAHTPVTGGAWTAPSQVKINPSGSCINTTGASDSCSNAAVPPAADYYVEASIEIPVAGNGGAGVIARSNGAGTNNYRLWWDSSTANYKLLKLVGGSPTTLGTYGTDITGTGPHTIRLTLAGTTLTATIDGVDQAPVTDATYAAAGLAGIHVGTNSLISPGGIVHSVTAAG